MRHSLPLVASLVIAAACSTAGGRRVLDLEGRTDDLPYSHLVIAGDTVYVAGTIGVDPATGRAPADPELEARLALDGVRDKLALAGLTMDDVVSVQVFCSDPALYDTFNAVYRTYFTGAFPARAFVGSGPLLRGGHFELCAVAIFP